MDSSVAFYRKRSLLYITSTSYTTAFSVSGSNRWSKVNESTDACATTHTRTPPFPFPYMCSYNMSVDKTCLSAKTQDQATRQTLSSPFFFFLNIDDMSELLGGVPAAAEVRILAIKPIVCWSHSHAIKGTADRVCFCSFEKSQRDVDHHLCIDTLQLILKDNSSMRLCDS